MQHFIEFHLPHYEIPHPSSDWDMLAEAKAMVVGNLTQNGYLMIRKYVNMFRDLVLLTLITTTVIHDYSQYSK